MCVAELISPGKVGKLLFRMVQLRNSLKGTGVLYFKGNVMLLPGSNSSFSGLIYVDGNLTVRAPSEILGAIVVTGNVSVQGAADFATITYDDDILNALRLDVGQYRLFNAFRRPLAQDN